MTPAAIPASAMPVERIDYQPGVNSTGNNSRARQDCWRPSTPRARTVGSEGVPSFRAAAASPSYASRPDPAIGDARRVQFDIAQNVQVRPASMGT